MTILQLDKPEIGFLEQEMVKTLRENGYSILNVPVLQDADIILDTIGERARGELFFVEQDSLEQNALRYDFTLAVASHYLEMLNLNPLLGERKFASYGTVFRKRGSKQELGQVSFEYIGHEDKMKADAEIFAQALSLIPKDVRPEISIEISDIRLLKAVLSGDYIPPIKSGRLKSALRQPKKFLSLLTSRPSDSSKTLSALGRLPEEDAHQVMTDIFAMTGLKHSGMRSMEEISHRFIKKTEEANEPELEKSVIQTLILFYNLECPALEAVDKMRHIMRSADVNIDDFLQYFQRRLDLLKSYNIDLENLTYGPLLRRKPEYYSGFMFSITRDSIHVGGGGRYDNLFTSLGSEEKIRAVGCELRPECLL